VNTAEQNIEKPEVNHEEHSPFETVFALFIKFHTFPLLVDRPQDERNRNEYKKQDKK
jgi:hypothetical protein